MPGPAESRRGQVEACGTKPPAISCVSRCIESLRRPSLSRAAVARSFSPPYTIPRVVIARSTHGITGEEQMLVREPRHRWGSPGSKRVCAFGRSKADPDDADAVPASRLPGTCQAVTVLTRGSSPGTRTSKPLDGGDTALPALLTAPRRSRSAPPGQASAVCVKCARQR